MTYTFEKLEFVNEFSAEDKEIRRQKIETYIKDKKFQDNIGLFLDFLILVIGIAAVVLFVLYEEGIVSGIYSLCLGLISLVAYLLIHFHKINILEEIVCKKFFHRTAITEEYTKSFRKWKLQTELDNLVRNISSDPLGCKIIDISYQALINSEQLLCNMVLKDIYGNLKESSFSYELRKVNKNCHITCPVLDMESVELMLPADKKGNLLAVKNKGLIENKKG